MKPTYYAVGETHRFLNEVSFPTPLPASRSIELLRQNLGNEPWLGLILNKMKADAHDIDYAVQLALLLRSSRDIKPSIINAVAKTVREVGRSQFYIAMSEYRDFKHLIIESVHILSQKFEKCLATRESMEVTEEDLSQLDEFKWLYAVLEHKDDFSRKHFLEDGPKFKLLNTPGQDWDELRDRIWDELRKSLFEKPK